MTDRGYWWFRFASLALVAAGAVMLAIGVYRAATDDCTSRGGVRIQGACIDKAVLR